MYVCVQRQRARRCKKGACNFATYIYKYCVFRNVVYCIIYIYKSANVCTIARNKSDLPLLLASLLALFLRIAPTLVLWYNRTLRARATNNTGTYRASSLFLPPTVSLSAPLLLISRDSYIAAAVALANCAAYIRRRRRRMLIERLF